MPFRIRISEEKKQFAKNLRKNPTLSEKHLWANIRSRKVKGFKFRRQAPILGFIVDFFCPVKNLIIEVDGSIHDQQKEYDDWREEILRKAGFIILRFKNTDVLNNTQIVINQIETTLLSTT